MENYKIEQVSQNNLFHLQFLYKKAFHLNVDLDFITKKFNTDCFGVSYIGYLAIDKMSLEAAAYYGVFPVRCEINNTICLAAQSGDTMTHPLHQGKGLFTQLAKLTYELARAKGINFIFGFPNKNSYPGFVKKLGWNHYGDLNNYIFKTGTLPIDKIAKKNKFANFFYKKFVAGRCKKSIITTQPANSLKKQGDEFGSVLHDSYFFEYKKYSTYQVLRVKDVSCIIKVDGRLWIGDMDYCEEQKFLETVKCLIALAKSIYCSSVQFTVFKGSAFDRWLKMVNTPSSTNPVGCLDLSNKFNPEKFRYQAFDFDTF